MTFIEEIQRISESDSIAPIRLNVWDFHGDFMFGSDIDSIQEMSNLQAAFLHLMDEKWLDLMIPLIQNEVKTEFDNWHEEEGSYKEIIQQSIDLTNLEDGKWQILFEDDNMDLIVHLHMKEWEFDHTTRTG